MALAEAGRYEQDPRSPRKSAKDLIKAALQPLDLVAPFIPEVRHWDFEDRQRVMVQRQGVTRHRPALKEGWQVRFRLLVLLPEYIPLAMLAKLANNAGRMIGLCDYRPTYGRFAVSGMDLVDEVA